MGRSFEVRSSIGRRSAGDQSDRVKLRSLIVLRPPCPTPRARCLRSKSWSKWSRAAAHCSRRRANGCHRSPLGKPPKVGLTRAIHRKLGLKVPPCTLPPTAVVDDRRPVYAGKLKHFGQRCLRAQVFAVSREKGLQIGSVAMATEHSAASRAGLVCSTVVLVLFAVKWRLRDRPARPSAYMREHEQGISRTE